MQRELDRRIDRRTGVDPLTLEVHAMRHITGSRLLAAGIVVVLWTSGAGWAQGPQGQAPVATVRELATLEGMVNGYAVLLPGGRTLIYTPLSNGATMNVPRTVDSTFPYDIATKRAYTTRRA
jgi:hypothetical protein